MKALILTSITNSHPRTPREPCYAVDLKGRYVCTPFVSINESETALACFVSNRTYPRINVFLSEDFVLLVPSGDGHALRRLRVTLETQNVTTVIQIQK